MINNNLKYLKEHERKIYNETKSYSNDYKINLSHDYIKKTSNIIQYLEEVNSSRAARHAKDKKQRLLEISYGFLDNLAKSEDSNTLSLSDEQIKTFYDVENFLELLPQQFDSSSQKKFSDIELINILAQRSQTEEFLNIINEPVDTFLKLDQDDSI